MLIMAAMIHLGKSGLPVKVCFHVHFTALLCNLNILYSIQIYIAFLLKYIIAN
jgi:hypothetical protein